jgi:hypothetical protein
MQIGQEKLFVPPYEVRRGDGEQSLSVPGGSRRGDKISFGHQVKWTGVIKSFIRLMERKRGDEKV